MTDPSKPQGAITGMLFGNASRGSVLKGALTLGLTPPQGMAVTVTAPEDEKSETPSQSGAPKGQATLMSPAAPRTARLASVNPLEMQSCTPADVFSYYDRADDGLLDVKEFARAVRACGGCPSEKQVAQWFKELATDEEDEPLPVTQALTNKDGRGAPSSKITIHHAPHSFTTKKEPVRHGINKKTFVDEIPRLIHESPGPSRADILESLKTFTVQKDNQPGFILETETIRTVLGGMGNEHLQQLEVDAVLVGLEHKPGQLHFGTFLDRLAQRSSGPLIGAGKGPPQRPHAGPHHASAQKQRK